MDPINISLAAALQNELALLILWKPWCRIFEYNFLLSVSKGVVYDSIMDW
jgi:hypothetical protein